MLKQTCYWKDVNNCENECTRSCYQRRCDSYSNKLDYRFLRGYNCCDGNYDCCVRYISFVPSRDTFLCVGNVNDVRQRGSYLPNKN